jgi:hypothetical protein
LTEYLLEVTGTLPSVSPLQNISDSNVQLNSDELSASESCCTYLYTQTLMLFFSSSWMIGKTVDAESVQRLRTSLKQILYVNRFVVWRKYYYCKS